MTTHFLITVFGTLFVVINPSGPAPLCIGLARGVTPERRGAMTLLVGMMASGVRG